jgi:hypothetical protein
VVLEERPQGEFKTMVPVFEIKARRQASGRDAVDAMALDEVLR